MKRIDLLIQLVKNIYKLLKTHLDAPCHCTVPTPNKEDPFDQEEVNSIVQILKSIEKQVRVFNDLAIDRHNPNVTQNHHPRNEPVCQACPPKELEEWMGKQEVLDYLQISDRTYRRQVESGLLKPMNIGGGDFYFKRQLVEALEESRRRGRV